MKPLLLIIILTTLFSCASSDKLSEKEKKAMIFFNQGTQELHRQEHTKALTHLLQANKYNPNDSKILNNLGMAYYFKDAQAKAIHLIKKAIKLDPKNSDAINNLGTIYLRANNYEKAEVMYKKVTKDLTYQYQFRTYYNLGIIEREKNNTKKAFDYFKRSLKVENAYCPSNLEIGKIYYQNKKYREALKKFKDASYGKCYNNPDPVYYQALTHIKLDQFALAKDKLEDIISRFSLSKYETMARNQLRNIKGLQKREYLENQSQLFSKRKILTPDF